MLCPEVWSFKAPESSCKISKGNLNQTSFEKDHNNFNHLITLVLPDTLKVPETLTNSLVTDCEYYKILDLNVSEFVKRNFIEGFIKQGNLSALSINTRLDCDDCIAITPDGFLHLNINKATYQSLGLEGQVSNYYKKSKNRYIINIDLKCSNRFQYLKLLNNFNFILNWVPENEDVCPSSVAKYFHDLNYNISLCSPQFSTNIAYSIKMPAIDLDNCHEDKIHEFNEWLGMLTLNCDLENGALDDYINTYETPEPNIQIGQIKILQWKGFYTQNQIDLLYNELRKYTMEGNFAALFVQGFSDAPIKWNKEHHFYTNGDNSYVLLLNSTKYILCMNSNSNKPYK